MKRAAAWLLCALLVSSNARADAVPLAQSLTGEAKTDYELGRVLFARGDYAGALAKFEHARDLSPDARLLWNVAACQRKLGHFVKAVALVDRYVQTGGDLLSENDRREAARTREALLTHVAKVTVTPTPAAVDVKVDDESLGTAPFATPALVDEGTHVVRFSRQGFRTVTRTEQLAGGADVMWSVELTRIQVRLVRPPSANAPAK